MARRKHYFRHVRSGGFSVYRFSSGLSEDSLKESCRSKVTYQTIEEAESVARTNASRSGRKIEAYQCPICGFYHLTSSKLK